MRELYPEDWPQFYTATIQGWKHLLKEEEFKNVIINALRFLVEHKRVKVNAFVSQWLSEGQPHSFYLESYARVQFAGSANEF